LVDAEIRFLTATGGPTALDWRRLHRAEQRGLRQPAPRGPTKDETALRRIS